ncbi:MAG: hypothetical protein WC645_05030 [Candidatus Margulisiibacteriota bacterium]
MTSVESYFNVSQCTARELRPQDLSSAQDKFTRDAGRRIRAFLQEHDLPAEMELQISFSISRPGEDLEVHTDGPLSRELLEKLQGRLFNLARNQGICNIVYSPPTPFEEDEEIEPEQPRVAQRREAPPEPNVEVRFSDDFTLEVQTPPTRQTEDETTSPPPPPDDEASHATASVTKEPRETNTVMNFPENYSEQQVTLPDGRVLIIHVAPGVEILNSNQ